MPALLAGLALLGLLLLFARGYTGANPRSLARGARLSGGVLLALLTIALIVARELPLALLSAGGAWFLLFNSPPPWQRTSYRPNPGGSQQGQSSPPPPRMGTMSRAEALKVLGLEQGATEQEIRAAHRKLIQQVHPDKGGTSYLAAKINEAKDVLLRGR